MLPYFWETKVSAFFANGLDNMDNTFGKTILLHNLHLAPLQGGEDAAFGKGCKAREGGLGF